MLVPQSVHSNVSWQNKMPIHMNYQFHLSTPNTERDNIEALPQNIQLISFTDERPTETNNFLTFYRYFRTVEWIQTVEMTLVDKLQPGFVKFQNKFSLGSIHIDFFLDFMNQFQCIAKKRRDQENNLSRW